MDSTPQQQALLLSASLTPQQRIAQCQNLISYVQNIDLERAPVLTIDGDPDGPDESQQLAITGADYLAAFQQITVAAMEEMIRADTIAMREAGIPEGCTTSELVVGNGITVTIVHPPAHVPPLAYSEDEVQMD